MEVLLEVERQKKIEEGGDRGEPAAGHRQAHVDELAKVAVGEAPNTRHPREDLAANPAEENLIPERAAEIGDEGVQPGEGRELCHPPRVPAREADEEQSVAEGDKDPEEGAEDERPVGEVPGGAVGGDREAVGEALPAATRRARAINWRQPARHRHCP